jgi:acyl-CoA synthetase (AMP-forming)/AMP-acid ligase II
MTLIQPVLVEHLAERFPAAVAWKNMSDGRELLMSEWHTRSNQLARGMRAQGLTPGDRVALAITPDEPLEWLVSYMAIHKAGGVAVPLNTRLSQPELRRILQLAEPKLLLASAGMFDDAPSAGQPGALIATTGGPGPSGIAWVDLFDEDESNIGLPLQADDVADIMYTSGTTGAPKGVVVRHGGLSSNDRVPSAWNGLGFLTSSPFSTTTGSLLVCGPMRGGMSGWFLPKFNPQPWLRLVETERPGVAFLVPAMMQLVVADPSFERADLSSLSIVSVGSAPIASETLRRFGARVPSAEIMIGYGMTEFGAATSLPIGDAGRHLGSVGTALPGVTIRIVDDAGTQRATGEVGQIVLSGDRPQRVYFNELEESRRTWKDGWLQSGDLGYLDADDYLWVVGRMKETIIRGGHNIMPGEVESALFAHPEVADAAVAGVPHEVLGEDVAAWIVLRRAGSTSIDAIRAFLLERLADYKVPRRITFVDALPRNEAGKVLKSRLKVDDAARSTK